MQGNYGEFTSTLWTVSLKVFISSANTETSTTCLLLFQCTVKKGLRVIVQNGGTSFREDYQRNIIFPSLPSLGSYPVRR